MKRPSLRPRGFGTVGRPFRNHRQFVEGIAPRYRGGIARRDLPEQSGPWQKVWKRHHRFAADGIWDRFHAVLLTQADAAVEIDWTVSVDSTISRAHQHGEIHHACDGKGGPLAFIIGPGQGGSDSRMFPHVIDAISVPHPGTDRARTRPTRWQAQRAR